MKTYQQRAENAINAVAKDVLQLLERKKSNLCIAADLVKAQDLLDLAEKCGPYIAILKTHVDIIEDFTPDLAIKLSDLSKKHDFMIFEDRKFADIGNTVKLQYSSGIYKIASWSHFTNAHVLPGEGIIQGLYEVGHPLGRGLLLLAEMSSKGHLLTKEYSNKTLEMAIKYSDFVFGFIGQHRLDHPNHDFIYMSPGVQLGSSGDSLGQQYRTPRQVILDSESDIIIVGRGIYGDPSKMEEMAQTYQKAGWDAYIERCS
jgi:orotidine-5'-phosphate decarboxylase